MPYEVEEKKQYIEEFLNNFLIKTKSKYVAKKKIKKVTKAWKNVKPEQIKTANGETISLVLNKLNTLFEINKIEKEEKIKKSIEYVLNDYLNKNKIFNDNNYWYENIIENNFWEIINHLPEI